ncbi:hypothetical protein [Leeia oryzae]|uniref:hypothetical protein n=1 Tax=Leeia oryzae TaxID=356662 RepID=UPI000378EF4E|nr:hypothetical protein [Leeia oryzae]
MDAQLFHKTDAGRNEIISRQLKLPAKVRRLLILIDGQKTTEALSRLAGQDEDIKPLLQHLLLEGLISATANQAISPLQSSTIPSPKHAPSTIVPSIDASDLADIKHWMLDGCQQYLGIMGADIRRRIEAASDAATLKKCIAPWIMALRDSKTGHAVADTYLSTLHARFG